MYIAKIEKAYSRELPILVLRGRTRARARITTLDVVVLVLIQGRPRARLFRFLMRFNEGLLSDSQLLFTISSGSRFIDLARSFASVPIESNVLRN